MFCSQPHTGSHGTSSLKVTDDFLHRQRKRRTTTTKKNHAAPIENVFLRRECSLFQKKRKEKNNRNCMTSLSFSYCEHCCSQRFFLQLQREKLPLRTSTLKVTVFLHQQNKNLKKCSTTRKGPHLPRKFSFPKQKKKKKEKKKRDLTTSTSHSFSHCKRCSLRFFSAAAAREAREAALRAASRFSSLLAAASRFCCSIHGNCSASRTKSQILQPCDPGLIRQNAGATHVKKKYARFRMQKRFRIWQNFWCTRLSTNTRSSTTWRIADQTRTLICIFLQACAISQYTGTVFWKRNEKRLFSASQRWSCELRMHVAD